MARRTKTTTAGTTIYCKYDKLVSATTLLAASNPKNYRHHPPGQVAKIANVIKANGWRRAVVVSRESGRIVKGHGATMAAKLNEDQVPVEYQSYANEAAELADLVADNKAGEGAEDDVAALAKIVAELGGLEADTEAMGLSDAEATKLLEALEPAPPPAPPPPGKLKAELAFADEAEYARWLAFVRRLKQLHPKEKSVAARLLAFVDSLPK